MRTSNALPDGLSGRSVMQIKELFADFINGRIETQTISKHVGLRRPEGLLFHGRFHPAGTINQIPKVLADWY